MKKKLTFNMLHKFISKQVSKGRTLYSSNNFRLQIYGTSNPCTILISSYDRPMVKIQYDTYGIFTLFFQKRDIPNEIGYTGYRLHETDPIDKLLAKDILNNYPIAKEVYEYLITLLNEREDKQND
ncbi:hypothetical protein Ana3638_04890 [Anaerocolumna sedimenticola]|uniref:Uncharacterized protein n=1 Tax=Anaerocolumna sedimenticola TaxID=2696063 RepID=A0A6P1TJW1_9FIRM|nr:hypothetical protein [Anaerocolumna sedimenticola]QHQ60196.1 hypothetical protein Ana3638_04890 [Anaerocolumna sedimenticola]